jgi:agmatine/peptidylarginine deiminase
MKLRYFIILAFIAQAYITFGQSTGADAIPYYPSNHPRMVAEWEPAVGVLITWPLTLPHKLVVELAKDTKVQILVADNKSKTDAIKWLSKWGILPDRIRFITAPIGVDAAWTRDWGPHAVFNPDGNMLLADGKYLYATPVTGMACDDSLHFLYYNDNHEIQQTRIDDKIPDYIAASNDLDMVSLPFAFTGGNVISDGQRTAFSTCALVNENKFIGEPEEKFFKDARKILGIENYNIISNFEDEGIQHIDCFMKLLDEERIFVARPPADHPSRAVYEGIVTHELSKLKNAFGRPYQILWLDTDRYQEDRLAAYTNSLILNQNIYVPLFGIPQDSMALKQWADAMPGYTIKGFEYVIAKEPAIDSSAKARYKEIGWTGGDALHCRTRAIWDLNMIYISVDRIPANVPKASAYLLDVIIKDYSKGSLTPETLKVMWRVKGKQEWKEMKLTKGEIPDHYQASFPGGQAGVTIEYYVTAHSNWGDTATMPRTAPKGLYEFKID